MSGRHSHKDLNRGVEEDLRDLELKKLRQRVVVLEADAAQDARVIAKSTAVVHLLGRLTTALQGTIHEQDRYIRDQDLQIRLQHKHIEKCERAIAIRTEPASASLPSHKPPSRDSASAADGAGRGGGIGVGVGGGGGGGGGDGRCAFQ